MLSYRCEVFQRGIKEAEPAGFSSTPTTGRAPVRYKGSFRPLVGTLPVWQLSGRNAGPFANVQKALGYLDE